MRLRYKAGLGLCAGLGLALACRPASACEVDDEDAPAALDEDQAADSSDEQQNTTAEEQPSTPPEAQPQRGGGAQMPYPPAPPTGEPGPGWSPIIGGAPMMGIPRQGLYGPSMMGGQTCCACCGAPRGPAAVGPGVSAPRALGAGVGGPPFEGAQPFGIGPIYSGFGAWSPSVGIGPRAYGNVIGGH
jgi:hypothetical protein